MKDNKEMETKIICVTCTFTVRSHHRERMACERNCVVNQRQENNFN